MKLADATNARYVTRSEMSAGLGTAGPLITYVLSIDYTGSSWTGNTLTWSQTSSCGSFQAANMPSGWNDAVKSVATYSGCANTQFWNSNFGSPTYSIGVDSSVSDMGVFDDNTSSEKWCPTYPCG